MKLFGLLAILFGWASLEGHGFSWDSLIYLVVGIIVVLGEELSTHVLYIFKNERLKIDRTK